MASIPPNEAPTQAVHDQVEDGLVASAHGAYVCTVPKQCAPDMERLACHGCTMEDIHAQDVVLDVGIRPVLEKSLDRFSIVEECCPPYSRSSVRIRRIDILMWLQYGVQ